MQIVVFMAFCIQTQTLKVSLTAIYPTLPGEVLPPCAGQGKRDFSAEKSLMSRFGVLRWSHSCLESLIWLLGTRVTWDFCSEDVLSHDMWLLPWVRPMSTENERVVLASTMPVSSFLQDCTGCRGIALNAIPQEDWACMTIRMSHGISRILPVYSGDAMYACNPPTHTHLRLWRSGFVFARYHPRTWFTL